MKQNPCIIRALAEKEGGLAALGDRLGALAGLPKDRRPNTHVIWNWTGRGTPMKWRYYVAQLAREHGIAINETEFMTGAAA